jgi:regulatory protein
METEKKKAEKYCLRLLAMRARTSKEISKRLEEKGFSPRCRQQTVKKLIDKKLVNDAVFAVDWIESRVKYKPRSRELIKHELLQKGVSEEIIERTMAAAGDILDDRSMSARAVEQQLGKLDDLSGEKKKQKLFRSLLMRGFDMDTARDAVNSAMEGL